MTIERFLTLREAALALGVPTYALRNAVKRGDVPVHRPFSKRWVVRLSEIEAFIETTANGGADQ